MACGCCSTLWPLRAAMHAPSPTRRSRRSGQERRRALAEHGIRADIVPERSIGEALVESLRDFEVADRPVLIARAAEARDVLPEALRERGAKVDLVALYETVAEQPDPAAVEAAQDADYVTFTSSSTVRNFIDAVGGRLPEGARIVSIGPVTSEAAREAGLTVDVEADRHDPDGLIEALIADASGRLGHRTWPARSPFSPTTARTTSSPASAGR